MCDLDAQLKMVAGISRDRPTYQSELWAKAAAGDVQNTDWTQQYSNTQWLKAALAWYIETAVELDERLLTLPVIGEVLTQAQIDVVLSPEVIDDWIEQAVGMSRTQMAPVVAQQYIEGASTRIGTQQTATWTDEIRRELVTGIDAGESTKQIAKRIEGLTSDFAPFQAERIARTETAFASVNASEMGWAQSGVVQGKIFVLAPAACPICRSVAAQYGSGRDESSKVLPLGQNFYEINDSVDYQVEKDGVPQVNDDGTPKMRPFVFNYSPDGIGPTVPPVHPNCRCSTRPIILEV